MIGQSIDSVFAQSYRRLEIIIVDDGSTDGTGDVIKDLIRQNSGGSDKAPEIRYFYQSNMGQSRARNAGIAAARGDWVAFLDSDDYWLPDKIELQLRALEQFKSECGACICDARLVDKPGNLDINAFQLAGRHFNELMGILPNATAGMVDPAPAWWIQTLLVRSDLARQVGGFDDNLHFMEDRDFLFRLSLLTSYCYVNLPLAVIDRANTATDPNARVRRWDCAEFRLNAQRHLYEKWLALSQDLPSGIQRAILTNLRQVHSGLANQYLRRDQFALARQAVSRAIACEFTSGLAIKWLATRLSPRLAKKFAPAHGHRH